MICKKQSDDLPLTAIHRKTWRAGRWPCNVMAMPSVTHSPIRLAFWYGKGGVGKSTTTILLALLAARRRERVLVIDLDPECGTSRDFLGKNLGALPKHLKSYLESSLPTPPPIISTGINYLDVTPCPPDEQRFFRHYPEHSSKLAEGLSLLGSEYQWVFMDVPNQFDNIVELGLAAAEYLILPVELTADCVERIPTVLRLIEEARTINPSLKVLGALALAAVPRAGQSLHVSAKERLIHQEYAEALAAHNISVFKTIMFRSATTVEEARSSADPMLLHWTAKRRFQSFFAEIHFRIRTSSPASHAGHTHSRRAASAESVAA